MPWWRVTNAMATANGHQSWYSTTTPTMMKKWKWASIVPPERCTSTAEAVTSPSDARTVLTRLCR